MIKNCWLWMVIILSIQISGNAYAQSGDALARDMIENIKKTYQAISDVSAEFEQTFFWKLTEETQTIKGKIFVKDGSKYRIQTPDQLIITDGKIIWTSSEANQQVIIDVVKENAQGNPLMREFITRYSDNYVPKIRGSETVGGVDCTVIELTSKNEDTYIRKVRIWVDPKTYLMLKVEQTDINENITTYRISNITAKKIDGDLFEMKTPVGFEVIDLR